MTAALLDVNVLIALIDTEHVHHQAANDWFAEHAAGGWASCPLTQNGAARILAGPAYPGHPGSAAAMANLVTKLCARSAHRFWPDSISLLDPAHVDQAKLPGWRHLTDTYLLALARARAGRLVTFDRRLRTAAVPDGEQHLEFIGA